MPGPHFPFDRREWCMAHIKPGGCRRTGCHLRHDFLRCACGWVVKEGDVDSHRWSARHRAFELQGRPPAGVKSTGGSTRCGECNRNVPADRLVSHMGWHHRVKRREEISAALENAERDKDGISVSGLVGVDFGVVEANVEEEHEVVTNVVGITKTDEEGRIMLARFNFGSETHFRAELIGGERNKWIWTGKTRTVLISFHGSVEGRYEDMLTLLFRDVRQKKYFAITRKVFATVGDVDDHELLAPAAPYVRRNWAPLAPPGKVIPSNRPPQWSAAKFELNLPKFEPPSDLLEACFRPDGRPSEAVEEIRQKFLPRSFNITTYGDFFQILLHIEEEKLRRDLDQYAMSGVTLAPSHPRYNLLVEGLAEGRPSVLVGDFIRVKHSNSSDDTWYEGRVHEVYENHVNLAFCDGFSTFRGTKFDVRFVLNRLPHRRMHFAMSYRYKSLRMLFPDERHVANVRPPTEAQLEDLIPVNRLVGSNPEQMRTVCSIMNLPKGCAPFIIFGPPGTGKTMTLVETIHQLVKRDPDIRILACAPSNSAADLIAQKLTALGPSRLFRLNSLSRKITDNPPTLSDFVLINENRVFTFPEKEQLEKYNIIVSTCISGGVPGLLGLGIRPGHFEYIFIDEAGQAKEPEALIPIMCNANQRTNIVLAGDNQQLGPICSSNLSAALGLKTSYLARLMDLPVYDLNGPQPPQTIVKLVKNFRSHPDILSYPNAQFYGGQLETCGDPVMTHSLDSVEELPKSKFPIAFHAIVGKDQREETSPSFFNVEEASLVRKYVHSLTQNRKYRITEKDVGVITPYHAQRCKIRELLRKINLTKIKVGSVEEFQGQERRVIIMSTVRSSSDHLSLDIRRNLGFVAEPRRFNVAITRAQSLLIVIGNPSILSLDPIWSGFMEYVHSRGGWKGVKLAGVGRSVDDRMREEEERLEQLRELILTAERSDGFLLNEDELEDEDDDGQGIEDYVERLGHVRLDE